MRILLIEDQKAHAEIWRSRFKSLKFPESDILWVRTWVNAREALQRDTFDLIVLDMMLPDAKGIELLTEVQKLAGDTQIQIFTASDIPGLAEHVEEQPHVSLTLKYADEIDSFRRAVARALPEVRSRENEAAIAVEIKNIWREMEDQKHGIQDVKDDVRDQLRHLRDDINRSQGMMHLAVDDLPKEVLSLAQQLKEVVSQSAALKERLESYVKEAENARVALQAIGLVANMLIRYWRLLAAVAGALGVAIAPMVIKYWRQLVEGL